MKAEKAEDMKTKTHDELTKLVMEMKKKQFNLRFQKSQGQVENTAQIRVLRRNIARAKTFITGLNRTEGQKQEAPKAAPKTKTPAAVKKAAPEKAKAKTPAKKAPAAKKAVKKTETKAKAT